MIICLDVSSVHYSMAKSQRRCQFPPGFRKDQYLVHYGPLLFLIYINDLPESMTSPSVDVSLFADDTKCFSIVESLADARVLKTEAGNMEKWAQSERLKFNAQKCKVLSITRKRRPLVTEYIINGETLLHVSSQKDLGVTFSSDLSWNVHIQEQVTKANLMLGM